METNKTIRTKHFSFRHRARSFRFAWYGIYRFFVQEHNARIHLVATIVVFIAACWCRLSKNEVISLVIVTGLVWISEISNTAIEKIMDFISPGYHPDVKFIKDLAAGAVLISALIALITGSMIFIPKMI